MLRVPQANWGDTEWLKWAVDVAARLRWNQFSLNPAPVPGASTSDETVTSAADSRVKGLRVGMPVTVTPPALPAGLSIGGTWVAADDSITIRFVNVTGAPIDAGSATYSYFGVTL